MKILYLITKTEIGGAQVHVVDLCVYFKKNGHEVTVMSSGDGWLRQICKKEGVNFVENKYFSNRPYPRKLFNAIREIKRCVKNVNPDIVHCHSSAAAILGRLAIRNKVRTIYTAHGWGFNVGIKPWIKYPIIFLEKICSRFTDDYICVSEFVRNLALKHNIASVDKMKVVYNGINLPNVFKSEEKTADNKVELSFVGRLSSPKMPELVIKAIDLLPPETKNDVKFLIVGTGKKYSMLKKESNKYNVNIEFTGEMNLENSLARLVKSDIFIFISKWEGFPYSILEAMSLGLPIIASDVGGVGEMVCEESGILVKNDIRQISQAILKLVKDKELRERMGQNGRKVIEQKFLLDDMLRKIEEIYEKS